jgi:hypothetical protein
MAAAMCLAGCGGGSGGGSSGGGQGSAPPANRAPVFTSAAEATVVENEIVAYQASATDADGNQLTYAIAGGPDERRFTITSTGQLRFVAAPDYDLPADSARQNTYSVQLVASDGQLSATLSLVLRVTNSKEGIQVRRVATGFDHPVAIAPLSATDVLVAERSGRVYQLDAASGARTLLTDVATIGSAPVQVVSVAVAANYATTGRFAVMFVTQSGFLIVQQYGRNSAIPSVLDNFGATLSVPVTGYAGGGWVSYRPSSDLLIATGDGNGLLFAAQNASSQLGKLILAAVNPDPYAGATPVFYLLSTVASGLHAPVGGTTIGDALLLGDRGAGLAHEVNRINLASPGANYGWPLREGTIDIITTPGLTDPALAYPVGSGLNAGRGIVGGATGVAGISGLAGQFVFADLGGLIWTVPASRLGAGSVLGIADMARRNEDFAPDQGAINQPTALAASASGVLYLADDDGEIFRVDAG